MSIGAPVAAQLDAASLLNGDVLTVLVVALLAGAVGALARLVRVAAVTTRREAFGAIFVGAIAAVAALYLLDPSTALKFIAACLVAGYAGPAVLDSVQARVETALAEDKAVRATKAGKEALEVAENALGANVIAESANATGAATLRAKIEALRAELAQIERTQTRGKRDGKGA